MSMLPSDVLTSVEVFKVTLHCLHSYLRLTLYKTQV